MQRSCRRFCYQRVTASSWLPAVSLLAGLTLCAGLQEAHAQGEEPFKFMNIHFETNASACRSHRLVRAPGEGGRDARAPSDHQTLYGKALGAPVAGEQIGDKRAICDAS